MRKQMSLFIWAAAVFGLGSVLTMPSYAVYEGSSGSVVNLTDGPSKRANTINTTEYKKYETRSTTRTYNVRQGNDMYYVSPERRGAGDRTYNACDSKYGCDSTMSGRADTARKNANRKYNLAHPFYQPAKYGFLSVTDFSSNINKYDFKVTSLALLWDGQQATWQGNRCV